MFSAMSSNPDVGGFIHLANLHKRQLRGLASSSTHPVKPIKKRDRGNYTLDASMMPPKRKASEDIASPRRVTRRRQKQHKDDIEPDELNLSSTKLVPPSTPGPSRLVMDCVEITTPRAIALRASAARASPTTHLKFNAPVPSTPSRNTHLGAPSPLFPVKVRPPFTPRVSPSKLLHHPNDAPATPSKRASRPSSPKKAGDLTTFPSPVKLPGVLPAHLAPCLRLQRRAILDAIRSSASSGDEGDSSTNVTAYTQLHSLLHGTTTRGEGNSCLLLGPRGSGKTSVRIFLMNREHLTNSD